VRREDPGAESGSGPSYARRSRGERRVTPAYLASAATKLWWPPHAGHYAAFVYLGALAVHSHSISLSQYVGLHGPCLHGTAPLLALSTSGTKFRCHRPAGPDPRCLAHERAGRPRDSLRPVTSLQGHIVVHDLEFLPTPRPGDRLEGEFGRAPGDDGGPRRTVGLGQSTLLRLLAGLLEPTSGSISYDGVTLPTFDTKSCAPGSASYSRALCLRRHHRREHRLRISPRGR